MSFPHCVLERFELLIQVILKLICSGEGLIINTALGVSEAGVVQCLWCHRVWWELLEVAETQRPLTLFPEWKLATFESHFASLAIVGPQNGWGEVGLLVCDGLECGLGMVQETQRITEHVDVVEGLLVGNAEVLGLAELELGHGADFVQGLSIVLGCSEERDHAGLGDWHG